MSKFNLFSKLAEELADFDKPLVLTKARSQGFTMTKSNGYSYSQAEVLGKVDAFYNSQFYDSGNKDSENQRKIFLNKVKFNADVAHMQTDIDVKNYLFIPDTRDDLYTTALMQRKFKIWARENYYGQLLNELGRDYSKYGTCVVKKIGEKLSRVPLRTLRNTQDAKSLDRAALTGGYVIEEHSMTLHEMQEYPDWNTEGFEPGKKYTLYERHALVPSWVVDGKKDGSDDEWVLAVAILCPDESAKKGEEKGKIVFIEAENRTPYEEAHWDKQDGRWLGIGEVENQFENQIAANLTANLRNRALKWASSKYFQSQGEIGKNLVADVKDGAVLEVGPNGLISQINTQSQHLADFNAAEASWDKNSKEKSFTFEVSTGEAMPSGTPFRLGVVLNKAVQSHWDIKRENFGLFLEKAFFELTIPIFRKQNKKAHWINVAAGSENYDLLKKAAIDIHTNDRVLNWMKARLLKPSPYFQPMNREQIEQEVTQEIEKSPSLFIEVPDSFYTDAKFHMQLAIVPEGVDNEADLTTWTTVYQSLAQRGDPRADAVLEIIMSLTGKRLPSAPKVANNMMMQDANRTQPEGAGSLGAPSPVA